jgi:aspartyl/glutamyl-tRNA(Asn/Gln) amidotransferase C subunit
MKIDLDKLSKLANLPIKKNDKLLKDLQEISHHFDILQKIDTDNVEPLYQVNDLKNIYRQDIAIKTLPIKKGYFVTKAVINKNG